jgi:glutamine synthetase
MSNLTPLHLTYIWVDGNYGLRSKVKIMDNLHDGTPIVNKYIINQGVLSKCIQLLPIWNFDGSSTGQASRDNSEVILIPKRCYKSFDNTDTDKFVRLLVLCECYLPFDNGHYTPHPTNHRYNAEKTFSETFKNEQGNHIPVSDIYAPLYGIEQEFFIIDKDGNPIEYNPNEPQGRFYCAVDSPMEKIINEMMTTAHAINLNVVGCNFEVAPGQAEIQLLEYGLKACDDLMMLRYVMHRVASKYGYRINLHPKPLTGDWNGSGAHVNYSDKFMRGESASPMNMTPYEHILHGISQLSNNHQKHIACYGVDNHKRLTGEHETSSIDTFTYGIANRGASVRIPRSTHFTGKGYFEDRRPASNFDPYQVLPLIFKTTSTDIIPFNTYKPEQTS